MKKTSNQKEESLNELDKKSSEKKAFLFTFIVVAVLAVGIYYFITKNSAPQEKPKEENAEIKDKPSGEKKAGDIKTDNMNSIRKNDSVQIPNPKYVGRYISEIDHENYRDLNADGTFYAKDGPLKGGGTFKIDSTVITFKYEVGLVAISRIIPNSIIDEDREVWKK